MYDELIKNLRHDSASALQNCEFDFVHAWMLEAADAIEYLQKQLEESYNSGYTHGLDDAAEVDLVKKMSYWWIPVTERLPKDDGEVLCINDYHFYIVGWLCCDDAGNYICESDNEIMYDVTHWMPLPEPPEDGES